MGVKRTQDSGRRDALGREIKVSGNTGERAGALEVGAGEDVVRSDFTGAKSSPFPTLESFDSAGHRQWEECAEKMIDDLQDHGFDAACDPEFVAAHKAMVARLEDLSSSDPSPDWVDEGLDRLERLSHAFYDHVDTPFYAHYGDGGRDMTISVPADATDADIEREAPALAMMISAERRAWERIADADIASGNLRAEMKGHYPDFRVYVVNEMNAGDDLSITMGSSDDRYRAIGWQGGEVTDDEMTIEETMRYLRQHAPHGLLYEDAEDNDEGWG